MQIIGEVRTRERATIDRAAHIFWLFPDAHTFDRPSPVLIYLAHSFLSFLQAIMVCPRYTSYLVFVAHPTPCLRPLTLLSHIRSLPRYHRIYIFSYAACTHDDHRCQCSMSAINDACDSMLLQPRTVASPLSRHVRAEATTSVNRLILGHHC
jgi:hypothetical protein